jgi:hypothetical protein
VNRRITNVGLTVVNYAGKLVLTLLVGLFFLVGLGLVTHFHQLLMASQAGLKNPPPVYLGKPAATNTGDPSVHPFWPEFPHRDPGFFQSLVINGIQVMTEEWDCDNSPDDVLSYYQNQMSARGWRNVTEQTYNLQPELRGTASSLQNENYIKIYRQVMDSTLVLNHDDWSLRISTEPSKKGLGRITVKFYAAATPSLGNFFQQMESSTEGNGPQSGGMDVLQQNGGDRYHTTILMKKEPPSQAFQEALADHESQGWKPVILLPKKQMHSGYFVWLSRGAQYAALTTAALPQGQGSSVTFVEVTPH